jgi:hypothetical protein
MQSGHAIEYYKQNDVLWYVVCANWCRCRGELPRRRARTDLPALVALCLDSRFRKKSTQPSVAKSTIFGSLSGPRLWPCRFFCALQGAKEPTWHPLPVYHNALDVLITVACMQAHEGRRGRADDRTGFHKVTGVFCNPAPSTDCFFCLYSTICFILS